jgi:hypothetical protein
VRTVNRRCAVAFLVAATLGGCATVENSLRKEDVATFRLAGVSVSFKANADVGWDDAVRAYAVAKGIPDHEMALASNTPEAKAFMQNFAAGRIKSGLERHLSPKLAGTRPVRLEVAVRSFRVASAVQRILIGGSHVMIADAILVDGRTNTPLVTYPELTVTVAAGQGVVGAAAQALVNAAENVDEADRVLFRYSLIYGIWLTRA